MTRTHPRHRSKPTEGIKATRPLPVKAKPKKMKRVRVSMDTFDSLALLPAQPVKEDAAVPARKRTTMESLASLVAGSPAKKKEAMTKSRGKHGILSPMPQKVVAMIAPNRAAGKKSPIARKAVQLPMSKKQEKKKYPIVRGRHKRKQGMEKPSLLPVRSSSNRKEKCVACVLDSGPSGCENTASAADTTNKSSSCDVSLPRDVEDMDNGAIDEASPNEVSMHVNSSEPEQMDDGSSLEHDANSEEEPSSSKQTPSSLVAKRTDFDELSLDFYSEIGDIPSLDEESSTEVAKEVVGAANGTANVTPGVSDKTPCSPKTHCSFGSRVIESPLGKKIIMVESLDEKAVYLCLSTGKYYRLKEVKGDVP